MRKEKTLDFGHMSVRIHEPTVEQVRNFLSREDFDFKPVDFMTGTAEMPSDLLSLLSDLSPESVKKLTLSELKEAMEVAGEMLRPFLDIINMLGLTAGYLAGDSGNSSTKSLAP